MKTIKLLGIWALSLMLGTGLGSCSDDEYESRLRELILPTSVSLDADDEESGDLTYTKTFRNEDLSNYEAVSDKEWCTVKIDYLNSTMTITAESNDTFDERSATITLTDRMDNTVSRSFPVVQKQQDCIQVDSTTYKVGTDGGQVVIKVQSNIDYTVQILDADWITRSSGTRGLQESKVILDVARNMTESARSAQVSITNEVTGIKKVVLIQQAFKSFLSVLNTQYTLDETAQEINIYVQTNVSFDCYTDSYDTWIKKTGSREVVNETTVCQKISVSAFTEKAASRSSTISIENSSHGEKALVTVTQTRSLYIAESSITLMSGSSQQLSLYNTGSQPLWTSSDEEVATVDDAGNVTGVGAGEATITVTSADGKYSDRVKVIVEKPLDLADYFTHLWQTSYTPYDGVGILSRLGCTITNKSTFDLTVKKVTLYCDDVLMTDVTYDETAGSLPQGGSMEFKADIPVEFFADSLVSDTTVIAEGDTIITESTIPGKVKENTHKYKLNWTYTYSGAEFIYTCNYPEKSSASVATTSRRNTVRRRR